MSELLKIQGLSVMAGSGGRHPRQGGRLILDGISLSVSAGEVVALIGESGAGKSTLGLAALGYYREGCQPCAGQVQWQGQDSQGFSTARWRQVRGHEMAYVAQSAAAAFNPSHSIDSQVTERVRADLGGAASLAWAEQLYRQLALPDPGRIGRRYPHQLSGGQLQRLMAAMAFAAKPDLVVFDEPTTALDVTTQLIVLQAIKRIVSESGTAALYVSHDLAVVAQVADRILVLKDGQIVEQGPAAQIINAPRTEYARALVAAAPRLDFAAAPAVAAQRMQDSPLLSLRGIQARYPNSAAPVLHDIDLQLPERKVIAIVGESGSGKSTLARVIAGLLPPCAGELQLAGAPLAAQVAGRSQAQLQQVQMIFQIPDLALNPRQTVGEIIGRPLQLFLKMPRAARARRVAELLELVELPADFAQRLPGALSGGQKQRVGIARALAAQPKILLCDEVLSALDTVIAKSVLALLRRLQQELDLSFLFITHDLATVSQIADEIVVMHKGRIVERGAPAQLLGRPREAYTRELVRSVPQLRLGWLDELSQGGEATCVDPFADDSSHQDGVRVQARFHPA